MKVSWKRVMWGGAGVGATLGAFAPGLLPVYRVVLAFAYIYFSSVLLRRQPSQTRHFMLVRLAVIVAVLGAFLRLVHGALVGESFPLPSPADVLGYLFYVFLVWAGVSLVRFRTRERSNGDSLDAFLVGLVAFSAQFCFVLDAYLGDASLPMADRLVNSGYVLGTTALIMVAARISFGPGARNGSYYLLAGSAIVGVTNDLALQLESVGRADLGLLPELLAPLGLVFLTASVVHPGAGSLGDRPNLVEENLGRRRQLFIVGAGAYGIASVAWMSRFGSIPGWVVASVCSVLIVTLTVMRMKLMVEERQDAVLIEQRLRSFTSIAATATAASEIDDLARRFLGEIIPELRADRVFFEFGPDWSETIERLPVHEAVRNQLSDAEGSFVRERLDAGSGLVLESQGSAGLLSIAIVTAPCRSNGRLLVYVELDGLLTRRRKATLESMAVQLGLLYDGVAVLEQLHRRRSDDRFRALVQDSNDVVFVVDRQTSLAEFVSPTLHRLLGRADRDLIGSSPFVLMHETDRAPIERRLALSVDAVELAPTDVRLQHANGQFVWFSLSIRDLSEESEVSGLLFSFSDIHDRKMAELQLSTAEARYRALVTNSNDVLALLKDDVLAYVSPNVERIFGYPSQELIGARAESFISERRLEEIDRLFDDGRLTRTGAVTEAELTTRSGEVRVVELTFADPGLDDGEYMVTIRDVSERRRLESSLRDQALHDRLTGLFNRASVYPELQRSLQRLEPGQHLGVLHLDIKDFKSINDSLGFEAGDALIVDIATRLRASLRRSDTIARLNGDEFAVVTTGDTVDEILGLVGRLVAVFDRPFELADRSVAAAVRIGAVLTENRSENATGLLEAAGLALRNAKADGTQMVVFEPWMREQAAERFELENGLIPGISRGEFFVVYQPLLNLETQQVTSTEALLRWQHPERGFVSPGVFIPLAERTGAIVQLGRWVLERACAQLRTWHDELPGGDGLSMSVNVSARQLEVPGEAARLRAIIDDSGIDPRSLILELTESVMLEDTEGLRNELEDFRSIGIRVAVDDFGTGAAGLGHLRDVPFDIVKIDKSYIDGLGESDEAHNLITGVIELAHGMRAKIVAEGIETPKQASLLRSMRCDYGQGFYLGRPMEPLQLEAWFAQGRAGAAAASIAPGNERSGRRRSDR